MENRFSIFRCFAGTPAISHYMPPGQPENAARGVIIMAKHNDGLKTKKTPDEIIELIVVIMLGITALLTAWGSWIGSLHGGNQATSYATSNNLSAEGNAEYNAGVQQMNQDMLLWNDVSDMQMEINFAQSAKDDATVQKVCNQLFYKLDENLTERMADAIGWNYYLSDDEIGDPVGTVLAWLEKDEAYTSPFFDEEYLAGYFETANDLLAQSQAELESGKRSNANGDAFGLVTVIYSVTLFLLGIISSFNGTKNKIAVMVISLVAFLFATIYMFTIPMPNGFDITSFFGH